MGHSISIKLLKKLRIIKEVKKCYYLIPLYVQLVKWLINLLIRYLPLKNGKEDSRKILENKRI